MEGDTLDDQDINGGQEEAAAVSPYEQETAKVFITDIAHKGSNDIISTPLDPVILSDIDDSLPAVVTSSPSLTDLNSLLVHVSNPVTSSHASPSGTNVNSLLDHVSSPINSSIANANNLPLSVSNISYALTLLAAGRYPEIASSPLSFNGFGANEISSPLPLPSKSSSKSSSNHHHSSAHNTSKFLLFYTFVIRSAKSNHVHVYYTWLDNYP